MKEQLTVIEKFKAALAGASLGLVLFLAVTLAFAFNPAQLSTKAAADALAKQIDEVRFNGEQIGGGVAAVYIPEWLSGPGGFKEPGVVKDGVEYRFYHLKFKNGVEGVNVGLVVDRLKRNPSSPLYVLKALYDEVKYVEGSNKKSKRAAIVDPSELSNLASVAINQHHAPSIR